MLFVWRKHGRGSSFAPGDKKTNASFFGAIISRDLFAKDGALRLDGRRTQEHIYCRSGYGEKSDPDAKENNDSLFSDHVRI